MLTRLLLLAETAHGRQAQASEISTVPQVWLGCSHFGNVCRTKGRGFFWSFPLGTEQIWKRLGRLWRGKGCGLTELVRPNILRARSVHTPPVLHTLPQHVNLRTVSNATGAELALACFLVQPTHPVCPSRWYLWRASRLSRAPCLPAPHELRCAGQRFFCRFVPVCFQSLLPALSAVTRVDMTGKCCMMLSISAYRGKGMMCWKEAIQPPERGRGQKPSSRSGRPPSTSCNPSAPHPRCQLPLPVMP